MLKNQITADIRLEPGYLQACKYLTDSWAHTGTGVIKTRPHVLHRGNIQDMKQILTLQRIYNVDLSHSLASGKTWGIVLPTTDTRGCFKSCCQGFSLVYRDLYLPIAFSLLWLTVFFCVWASFTRVGMQLHARLLCSISIVEGSQHSSWHHGSLQFFENSVQNTALMTSECARSCLNLVSHLHLFRLCLYPGKSWIHVSN